MTDACIEELILKIADGDQNAFVELYKETYGILLHYAKKYMYNKADAEDALSEVYVKVVKNAYTFNRDKTGMNWLIAITKNTALNMNRCGDRVAFDDNVMTSLPTSEKRITLAGKITLTEMMEGLNSEERLMVFAYYVEEKKLREIAEMLNTNKSVVQYRISRALKKMKKNVTPDDLLDM